MTEKELQQRIITRSAEIAKIIAKNRDCEIRPDAIKGIKVIRVNKKEV